MAKKPKPESTAAKSAETPKIEPAAAFEPTQEQIADLVRRSLGGISKRMARLILIDRARA